MELLVLGHGDQELDVEDGPVLVLEVSLEPRSGEDVRPSAEEAGDGAGGRHHAPLTQPVAVSETVSGT